jgi:hypothetical protein
VVPDDAGRADRLCFYPPGSADQGRARQDETEDAKDDFPHDEDLANRVPPSKLKRIYIFTPRNLRADPAAY